MKTEKTEMLELVDKHFKRAAMNMFNDLKENVSIIRSRSFMKK